MPDPVAVSGLELLNDQPESEASALWKGLSSFADSVAQVLDQLPSGSPILITGPWGSGKTTFLRSLHRRIDRDPNAKPRTVWFEAWRCESEGVLLPALVRTVWQAACHGREPNRELKDAFRLALLIATRGLSFGLNAFGQKDLAEALKELRFKDIQEELESLVALTAAAPERDPMTELHDRFAQLLHAGWPDLDQLQRRPVIFIDDLDRCSPQRAVALIEQIRSLVAQSHNLPCTFVVAVDREVLISAISEKFAAIGRYDGNRYLEKVFPMAFALPAPDKHAAGELVLKLLDKQFAAGQLADDTKNAWREALGAALSDATFANPRLMKRCINRFVFVKHFERSVPALPLTASQAGGDADIVLAKWLAASERWPALRRLVYQLPEEWARIAAALNGQAQGPLSPDAEAILQERGAAVWVRAELLAHLEHDLARYRTAELRLRRWGL